MVQERKPTEVTGRVDSSNAWRAHSNPRSRVLHAATSSSASASSLASEAAAHGVQASSRVWALRLAPPYNKAVHVSSSASRISGEASLIVPSGATCS
jgi:hypothetical protein